MISRVPGRAVQWLWMLLIVAAIVPAAFFALLAVHNRQAVLNEAESRARITVEILREHARKVFRTHEVVLDHLDDRIAGMSWAEVNGSQELHRYLARTAAQIKEIKSIWLIDGNGVHRSSSATFPTPPLTVLEREYFQTLREKDFGVVIGKQMIGKTNGLVAFTVARRRSSPSGEFDGVISLSIAPDLFAEFYRQVVRDASRSIVLLRADGSVLASDPPAGQSAPAVPPESVVTRAFANAEEGVFSATGEADGVERLYAFKKVEGFPVFVMLGLDKAEILVPWRRNLATYAAFCAPAWLLLVLVTTVALQRGKREEAALLSLRQEMARREAAEKALLQNQRMEALGQLTGGIAHDFNNLLTVIGGNLELIAQNSNYQPALANRIEAVQQATERGERLTRQLLAFSRHQSLEPEVIDLAAAVRGMSELLDRSLRGDVHTELDLSADLWLVEVDRAHLEMAVLNVAVNARDAMPAGGRLTISAHNATLPSGDGEIVGDFVALTIADSGTGMTEDVLKRVFEPFFTTKDVGKGTGLGLSQVFGFAKQSGGDVRIASAPNVGTRVTLYLPRSRSAPRRAVVAQHESAARPPAATILVVEDDEAVGDLAQALLEDCGYRVERAHDGLQALGRLSADPAVDLVFSDIVMPGGINGVDLARRVIRRWPNLPVVLTTGYSDVAGDVDDIDFLLLRKPYKGAELAAAIRSTLAAATLRKSAS